MQPSCYILQNIFVTTVSYFSKVYYHTYSKLSGASVTSTTLLLLIAENKKIMQVGYPPMALSFAPNFMKIDPMVQKLKGGHTQRQHPNNSGVYCDS
jgi:hypothetical protein